MADAVKAPAKKLGKKQAPQAELPPVPQDEAPETGGKKKRRGKEKAPKETKEARLARKEQKRLEKKAKGAKPEKKGSGSVLLLTALVVLLIAAGVFLYLTVMNDWGGVRTSLLTTVNRLDPQFRHLEEQKIIDYNESKAQLERDQAQLLADQQALERRKAELDSRQVAISQAETDLQPLYRRNLSEEKLAEIQKTGEIYEKMDPQVAAGIMSRLYDESYMAAILFYMKPQSAADVMSHMSADLAARVTTQLLKD